MTSYSILSCVNVEFILIWYIFPKHHSIGPADYQCISNYLAADMGYLDKPSVLSTIQAKDKTSGSALGATILITQSGNLARNATTPFTYNETSTWQFVLNAQPLSGRTLCNWS